MPHFDTALNIVNSAALEMGLVESPMSDPWGETNQNIVQLCALLSRAGRGLVGVRDWSQLASQYSFATVNGTDTYAVPNGFHRFINATAWNTDTKWPLVPLGPIPWQAVQTRIALATVVRPFRISGSNMYLYPTPTSAETIQYEFISRLWVVAADASTKGAPDTKTDTCLFDEPLMVAGLKLAFLRAKAKDTTYAQAEYDEALAAASAGDSAAPVLYLAESGNSFLLGDGNIPDTGYGD